MTVIELAIKLAINKLYSEIERQLTFQRGGGGCSEVGYGCKSFISAAAAATTTLRADSCYKKMADDKRPAVLRVGTATQWDEE